MLAKNELARFPAALAGRLAFSVGYHEITLFWF